MAPPNWDLLARNHIGGRDWALIRRVLGVVSDGFDASDMTYLSDALDPIVGPDFENRDNVTVFEFPGRHVASFHDGAAAIHKCAYVLRTVGNCLLGGQPTWASVDAYHFSFLAGRALLAFLGIHFVQIRDSHCVLDVVPEGISEQEMSKFRRMYPSAREPARLIFRARSSVIEQRAMWTILVRTIRVAKFEAEIKRDIDKIDVLSDGFGRSRNEFLYRNVTWIYEEDFKRPTRSIAFNDDIHSYRDLGEFFSSNRDANFSFAAIFARVLLALIKDIQKESGTDIMQTSYAPCLMQFPGFNLSGLDALFAGIYRKEGYGTDI
jgi:hypothetical protein